MAKKSAKNEQRELLRQPLDPDVCFVLFPSTHLTASSASVSLQSLLHQVKQKPNERRIQSIEYEAKDRRFIIRFEPEPKEA